MNLKAQRISRKLKVLNYAKEIGNVSKTCRYFWICRETFYQWKRLYEAHGEQALMNNKLGKNNSVLRPRLSLQATEPLFIQDTNPVLVHDRPGSVDK